MTRVATFAGIDRHPTDISEPGARWLIEQLGDPRFRSDAALEAATTIEIGLDTGGAIALTVDSREVVLDVLCDALRLSPLPVPDGQRRVALARAEHPRVDQRLRGRAGAGVAARRPLATSG